MVLKPLKRSGASVSVVLSSASWVALTRTSHCCATQNQEAVSLCQGDVHPHTASIVSDSARLICSVQTMVKIPNGKRWHILQTYQNHITFLVAEAWKTDCVLTDVNPLKALGMGLRVKNGPTPVLSDIPPPQMLGKDLMSHANNSQSWFEADMNLLCDHHTEFGSV